MLELRESAGAKYGWAGPTKRGSMGGSVTCVNPQGEIA
jgi:hypothetical protein